MYDLFVKIVNMGISAGWLVLAALILRLILKGWPKWITCALWAVVAVQLSCPFLLFSVSSGYFQYFNPLATTLGTGAYEYFSYNEDEENPEMDLHRDTYALFYIKKVIGYTTVTVDLEASPNPSVSLPLVMTVWAAGGALLLSYGAASLFWWKKKLGEAAPLRENIWVCDNVTSSFVWGVIRPRIYLSSSLEQAQAEQVIAHERAHLKRKDHWWKLLGYLLLAIYWFHPLMWAAYLLFCRDVEFACDEKVTKSYSPEERKVYAGALAFCGGGHRLVMTYPVAFGEADIKRRVRGVLEHKTRGPLWVVAAIAVCAVVLTGFLTVPMTGAKATAQRNIGESSMYSEQEIHAAMDAATSFFDLYFGGCTLTEITYDEKRCTPELCEKWAAAYQADRAMVLYGTFTTYDQEDCWPLNPNSTYSNYQFIVTQSGIAGWSVRDGGY